jgi:hypothetical protein
MCLIIRLAPMLIVCVQVAQNPHSPPAPMHFGRPQDILTTPLPAARPAPLLLAGGSRSAHTPDIPMHIHTFGGAAHFLPPPNPNLLAHGHGAPLPPVASPISTPTSPAFSSPFGQPGPALRAASGLVAATMSTLSVPVFGLGAAVPVQHASPPASALAKGDGKGKTRALAPRVPKQNLALDLAAPHSHFNSGSPLSSVFSPSAGPSPAGAGAGTVPPPSPAAGSWWVSGVGSVYGGSGSGEVGAFRFFSLDSWSRFFGVRGCGVQ